MRKWFGVALVGAVVFVIGFPMSRAAGMLPELPATLLQTFFLLVVCVGAIAVPIGLIGAGVAMVRGR